MAHSSLPIFLDPPNWQQSNQGINDDDDHQDPRQLPAFLPPPPLPPPTGSSHGGGIRPGSMAYRARLAMIPQPEAALKCPRCDSTNTKFCYFNNYSLSQPRHFCKACRRYWTRGGALRNVPVGGGFRKNKKKKKSNRSKSPTPTQTQMGNSRSIGGAISRSCNIESSTIMSHFPSHPNLQLPSIIPSLQQHFSRFGGGGAAANNHNAALNFAGIHIGNMNNNSGGGRELLLDQWAAQRSNSQQQQQQPPPFNFAGLEPPAAAPAAAAYPQNLQTEVLNNFGANCHQQLQNLTPFSRIPMKNEEQNQNQNQEQQHGILSNFLRPDQNSHFWGGNDHQNSWTDLSALSSSSSSHLL